jgi:starch-binding outer membrane protein, SusD/RagB family
MKNNILTITTAFVLGTTLLASCTKKLDLFPQNDVTSEVVYATPLGYKQSLAKIYGSMALTGNQGPAGAPDVYFPGSDEGGNSDLFRTFWKAQELSTDEAVVGWPDPGVQDFHNMNWTSSNVFLTGAYYKSLYQITLINEFLRQSDDGKLSSRNISGADAENIRNYRSEVRFLRAFQYWLLMDLFGNPPFVTENSQIGGVNPPQITRANLFTYIESELKAIEPTMPAAKSNEYGRADKGAVWALLARLYLNAEVYTGTAKYTDAITYSKKVIDAGYSLIPNYKNLMLADNNLNTSEFIFTINYDGTQTQGFGGTTFLTCASLGGSMNSSLFGVRDRWVGLRTTKAFVNKFPDNSGFSDTRAQFYQSGQNLDINLITEFTDGFAMTKYKNITRTGARGSNIIHCDIDMPLFRLAEMYLIYAEAFKRNGTGATEADAVNYINLLRRRAFNGTDGDITAAGLTLDFILDERARELYWEGHRRTDLIRYNRFVEETYLWPWKGGTISGNSVPAFRKLYPIPSADLNANSNLVQNPGY